MLRGEQRRQVSLQSTFAGIDMEIPRRFR